MKKTKRPKRQATIDTFIDRGFQLKKEMGCDKVAIEVCSGSIAIVYYDDCISPSPCPHCGSDEGGTLVCCETQSHCM